MVAIPARRASCGERNSTGRPARSIRPALGSCAPDTMRISEDLPAPLPPHTASTSPRCTARSTPSSATTPP